MADKWDETGRSLLREFWDRKSAGDSDDAIFLAAALRDAYEAGRIHAVNLKHALEFIASGCHCGGEFRCCKNCCAMQIAERSLKGKSYAPIPSDIGKKQ